MIQRFYIHNFRCFENFELPISELPSVLLVGMNGVGKSTIGFALEILQRVARGTNRVGDLVKPHDFTQGRSNAPMRFEITVKLENVTYSYILAFEFPEGFRELRVFEESLTVEGSPIYTRSLAQVHLSKTTQETPVKFAIDWHLVALPIIQQQSQKDSLSVFKSWLASLLVLRPTPSLIRGTSEQETLQPAVDVTNFGEWFSGLLASAPSAYSKVDEYLKQMMPDIQDIKNPTIGKDARSLTVHFFNESKGSMNLPFEHLSDGEKCFMIFALVIASNAIYGPLLCYWDEPDNYLYPSEVRQSVMALRKAFQKSGQLIVTSHNPEAIRGFSDESTLLLHRNSHLEPTNVVSLDKARSSGKVQGNFIEALIRGDIDA